MPPRQNYAFLLAYDGRPYRGFQPQAGLATICGIVNSALRQMGIGASAFGASRTDARVQALGQTCSFQTRIGLNAKDLESGLNQILPGTLRIRAMSKVTPSFHAHWTAIGKTYRYRISKFTLFGAKDEIRRPLPAFDDCRLAEAFQLLAQQPDLSAFSASNDRDGGKIRRIHPPKILESNSTSGTLIEMSGQGFGRYQIRNLVAAAAAYGADVIGDSDLLAMAQRKIPHPFRAPAEGLCLFQVHYPKDAFPFSHPLNLADPIHTIPFLENYLTAEEIRTGVIQSNPLQTS